MISWLLYVVFFFEVSNFVQCCPDTEKGANSTSGNFLCRRCGETIAHVNDVTEITSKLAQASWNKTISHSTKMHIQLFENPNDQKFKVVTFTKSKANAHEEAIIDASWFSGYAWQISTCPRCRSHLGWKFQPVNFNHLTHTEEDTFFGLILDNLLLESESNSLLINPHLHGT